MVIFAQTKKFHADKMFRFNGLWLHSNLGGTWTKAGAWQQINSPTCKATKAVDNLLSKMH
jgi:hypothetical protein